MFRYHQKVPEEVPVLDTKATFGLVSPIDFQIPTPHSLWNLGAYKTLAEVKPAKMDREQNLTPVKEDPIHQSKSDPKNESGCSIQ